MNAGTLKADILLFITAVIWGSAFVAQRVGMDHIGPYAFNGIRFALGSAALLPLIIFKSRSASGAGSLFPPKSRIFYLWAGIAAGFLLFLGASLQQIGLVYTTAGKAGFITGLYVVLVPIMGLFFSQRTGSGAWIGAFLAAVGLYLLSVTESFSIEFGDLLVLVSAFFWAGHVLLIAWLSPRLDSLKLASAQFAVCSVFSLGAAFLVEETTLGSVRAAAVPILYGGLMSVGVAYTLQVVAQRDAKPAHTAIILSLEAVFAVLAGWVLLGETMGLRGLAGCGLMLAGTLVSQFRP